MSRITFASQTGRPCFLRPEHRRTHMHVIGASNTGKSYFLENMIREDIKAGAGVCVIDPHGELHDRLVDWLSGSGYGNRRQVHIIDPHDARFTVGFNPLCAGDADPTMRVLVMVNALTKALGLTDEQSKVRLQKCLFLVLYALAVRRESVLEAPRFSHLSQLDEARQDVEALPSDKVREAWNEFHSYPPRQFLEYMESVNTRFLPFITSPVLSAIMGQTENVLDLKRCMEERHVVLVNLAGRDKFLPQTGQAIAAMLCADLYVSALSRSVEEAKQNPFYCYVDECARFLTDDVVYALDETRKFGLHYVLAHQRWNQLTKYGEDFAHGIMEGAQAKVVFRIAGEETAQMLGDHLFRAVYNDELRKTHQTSPVVVGHRRAWFENESTTMTDIDETVESEGGASTSGSSEYLPDEGEGDGHTESQSETCSWSRTRRMSSTEAHTRGRSEGLVPIIEERGNPLSLEEQRHRGIQRLRGLRDREALVFLPGEGAPFPVCSLDIKTPRIFPSMRSQYVQRFAEDSDFTHETSAVLAQIEERRGIAVSMIDGSDDEDIVFPNPPRQRGAG